MQAEELDQVVGDGVGLFRQDGVSAMRDLTVGGAPTEGGGGLASNFGGRHSVIERLDDQHRDGPGSPPLFWISSP
jgi:hypothetical protein